MISSENITLRAKTLRNPYEVNPVRNSSRCDSKPSRASNPAGIILGPNPAAGGTAEQRGIISNGVKEITYGPNFFL
jgi:hypothetical protein